MDIGKIEKLMASESLTKAQKEEIVEAATEAGIPVNIKKGCKSCYEKLLLRLYEAALGATEMEVRSVSLDGWMLRNVNDAFKVFGSSIVYSNATIGDLEVGGLHPSILCTHFEKANTGEGGDDVL